jgi:hypothetical protein
MLNTFIRLIYFYYSTSVRLRGSLVVQLAIHTSETNEFHDTLYIKIFPTIVPRSITRYYHKHFEWCKLWVPQCTSQHHKHWTFTDRQHHQQSSRTSVSFVVVVIIVASSRVCVCVYCSRTKSFRLQKAIFLPRMYNRSSVTIRVYLLLLTFVFGYKLTQYTRTVLLLRCTLYILATYTYTCACAYPDSCLQETRVIRRRRSYGSRSRTAVKKSFGPMLKTTHTHARG